MDIAAWLRDLGLQQYERAFLDHAIDGDVLAALTAEDLKELGVASLGDRKRLLAAIATLEASGESRPPPAPPPNATATAPEAHIPRHLARRILESRAVLEGERKQVTVLFADLQSSLGMIEGLDAEAARQLLDQAIGAMMAAVHRYEGTVNKVLGDGIMALFGAPIAQEDHAVRACYAALAIQRGLATQATELRRSYGVEVSARVGLNSGEVVVRAIGNDLSMDYDAIGPTVHLASRMEQRASPGSIRLTAATARLARGFIEVVPLGRLHVKGLAEPVDVFALERVGPNRTRLAAAAARGLTPLVGRTAEMEWLERARDLAGAGQGRVVAVVGEPGVGKSRLFHELLASPAMRDWLVLRSNSSAKASPWAPVIDLLRQYFEIADEDDVRRAGEKISGKLLALDAALAPVLPAMLALLHTANGDPEWQRLGAPQRRRRTLDGVRTLLLHESRVQPVALVVEDMHWVDSETQALFDGLVESAPTARLLVLANHRPEYRHEPAAGAAFTRVRLEALGGGDMERMLATLLGDDPALASLKRLLAARAEGSPLFIEESVRELVEAGALEGEAGACRLARAVDQIEIPPAIASIIAARIDRLAPEQKALLQLAAVIGEELPLALLEAAAELFPDELHGALGELRSREFLCEAELFPDIIYRFRHGLIRRVADDGLLQATRTRLHRRVGEALQAHMKGRESEVAGVLARHFALGGVPDRAAFYYLQAAARAKESYTYAAGIGFARSAAQLGERTGDDAVCARALELEGDLLSLQGELEPANQAYEAARALTADSEVPRLENKLHRPNLAARGDARIAWYEHGSGAETLLFINPIVLGLEVFQPIVEQLCQEFRIITIDPRGTGRSDPLRRPYDLTEHVEDVRAVIEQAGGPVNAVGLSRGSNLVIRLADAYPPLVRRLILIGGLPDWMGPGSPVQRIDYVEAAARFVQQGDIAGLVRFHFYRVYSEPDTQELAESSIARLLGMPREALLSFYDPDPTMDVKPLLGRVRVPTLVMHGTEDRQVPFAAGEYLAAHTPGAKLYPFRDCGHLPLFTATREFCDALRHFLRTGDLPSASSSGRNS
jgi:class 3 adenylate cyclase/pimeloyl-ACP methyl ester carboxylesterase